MSISSSRPPVERVVDVGRLELVDAMFDHSGVEVGFVAHMRVERHDLEAKLFGEVSHRQLGQSVPISNADCGVDDRLSCEFGSASSGHGCQTFPYSVQCTE